MIKVRLIDKDNGFETAGTIPYDEPSDGQVPTHSQWPDVLLWDKRVFIFIGTWPDGQYHYREAHVHVLKNQNA